MTVNWYIQTLLLNDAVREQVLKHAATLERILSHEACVVIKQLSFNLDIIEVSNGYAFTISKRSFAQFDETNFRGSSARAFVQHDHTSPPEPGLFKEAILNSFPNLDERVNMLNKFYQCLVADRMPQKIRKLVLVGPRDSGKTSWAAIFRRIIPPDKIASISYDNQFSATIDDETQIVIIDEWSEVRPNLAKSLLKSSRFINNNCPFYITTDHLPDFGDENENVLRRLSVFTTTPLPNPTPGADKWMYDNAMHCIAWIASVINDNINLVSNEERWYEDMSGNNLPNEMIHSSYLIQVWCFAQSD